MAERIKMTRSTGNVFADAGFEPEQAANLALRSTLMIQGRQVVEKLNTTQAIAAKRLGVTQSRLNLLLHGKIDLFTIDSLVVMLARAGYRTELKVKRLPTKLVPVAA